jgi:hypothetical protein
VICLVVENVSMANKTAYLVLNLTTNEMYPNGKAVDEYPKRRGKAFETLAL